MHEWRPVCPWKTGCSWRTTTRGVRLARQGCWCCACRSNSPVLHESYCRIPSLIFAVTGQFWSPGGQNGLCWWHFRIFRICVPLMGYTERSKNRLSPFMGTDHCRYNHYCRYYNHHYKYLYRQHYLFLSVNGSFLSMFTFGDMAST